MHLTWDLPVWAWPLLALFGVAAVLWIRRHYRLTEPAPAPGRRRLLVLLRVTALLILLLALAGPALVRDSSVPESVRVAVALENSASMVLRDDPSGPRRWDRALRLAAAAESLLSVRDPAVRVELLAGNGLEPVVPLAGAAPEREGTDLPALLGALGRLDGGPSPRGVVLIGDGNDAAGGATEPPRAVAGPAVVLVGVGDVEGPPDRTLAEILYPEVAYQGDVVVVEATVGLAGDAAGEGVTLVLRDEQGEVARAEASPGPDDALVRLELSFRPRATGLRLYEAVLDSLPGERYLANNSASLAIAVRKGRARLLCLSGGSGWDPRFLALAALREERLELAVARRRGGGGWTLADSAGVWSPPTTAAQWRRWDGVVLAGWDDLDGLAWPSLAQAVREGLGFLVLAAGSRQFPPAALADVLPVDVGPARSLAGPWRVVPAVAAPRHPVLDGVTHGVDAAEGIDAPWVPPLTDLLDVSPRPRATRLLDVVAEDGSGERRSLLAIAGDGAARVVWFGGDPFWGLVFWMPPETGGVAARPALRLARNLLVWTAVGSRQAGLTLTGSRNVYSAGERVRLESRGRDIRGVADRDAPVIELRALDDTTAALPRSFTMNPDPAAPGRASLTLPPLPPGRYAVRPRGEIGTGAEQVFVVEPRSAEAAQIRQDRRRLRALAAAVDGAYVDGSGSAAVARLAAALERFDLTQRSAVRRTTRHPLSSWPAFLLVVLLLGVEWGLRRRLGML